MDEDRIWLQQLRWREVLFDCLTGFEKKFSCQISVDNEILADVTAFTMRSLSQYGLRKPNVAKIAGTLSFWFRKLKPIGYMPGSGANFTAVNELLALMLGLSICQSYKDDLSNPDFKVAAIPKRLLVDWVNSLRAHSHSPNSAAMSFELAAANVV